MKITFLGTGTSQGVPVITCQCAVCQSNDIKDQRLRSSVLIETNNKVILIDAGPDFRQQILREGINQLDAILITHGHKDHVGGLDDVRAFNFFQKRAMDVYARNQVHDIILKEFDYAFGENKYPGTPVINLHEIINSEFEVNGVKIIPIDAMHAAMPVFGFRVGNFGYLTDISQIDEKEKEKLFGLKVVVIGALRKKAHHSHFNLDQALELINEIKPEKAYLTHISHLMGLQKEMEKELPENVYFAFDGLKIKINE